MQHFAKVRSLSPAILTRVFNVANAVDNGKKAFSEVLLTLFNEPLQAQGKKKIEPLVESKLSYQLEWVSCNENIHKILRRINANQKRQNLLLWSAGHRENRLGRLACRAVRYAVVALQRV